ncbi:hypothetical protein ACFQ2Y_13035 [Streptomyces malaysiensis subsp. malaysiensis]
MEGGRAAVALAGRGACRAGGAGGAGAGDVLREIALRGLGLLLRGRLLRLLMGRLLLRDERLRLLLPALGLRLGRLPARLRPAAGAGLLRRLLGGGC